jgi:hypothetical protein
MKSGAYCYQFPLPFVYELVVGHAQNVQASAGELDW